MPTQDKSDSIPAAVRAWRMAWPAATVATTGKPLARLSKPSDVMRAMSASLDWPSGAAHVGI
jgi:hypothetical protein